MKRKSSLSIIATLIVTGLIVYLLNPFTLDYKKEIPSKFILSNRSGFDLTLEQFNFGELLINQTAVRQIDVKNDFNRKVFIIIESKGDIKDNIIVSDNNFYLEPGQSKELSFTAFTHGLTEYREYLGYIVIISKRV